MFAHITIYEVNASFQLYVVYECAFSKYLMNHVNQIVGSDTLVQGQCDHELFVLEPTNNLEGAQA